MWIDAKVRITFDLSGIFMKTFFRKIDSLLRAQNLLGNEIVIYRILNKVGNCVKGTIFELLVRGRVIKIAICEKAFGAWIVCYV